MTDLLNSCPTCGRQMGACRHTTEGQVTNHTYPYSRAMSALLGQDPNRPQPADDSSPSTPRSAASGGADLAVEPLKRALLMLTEGYDGNGFKYESLADRISYASASIRVALGSLESK